MSVRRSISINFVAKYLEHGLALIAGIVLAHWLTPEDFGIYSIAASVVVLGYLFRNFGVGQYLIQAKTVTDDMLRVAFTVTLVVSWSIGLFMVLIAPWLGEVYEEPGVTQVLFFLSINFFLLPFGSITNALLRRDMLFEKVAVIDVSAAVTSLVVGLTAAWFGASYMSIAWASNASTLVAILVTHYFRPPGIPWLPGVRGFREVLGFGVKVGAMDLSNSGSDSTTELVIGKVHSLHDLGIYSRAYGTFRLFEFAFVQTIRPVVLPALSRAQHGEENLGDIYLKIVSLATIFAIPFFVFLGLNAAEVIGLLYGDQWGAAVPILQVMCFAGALFAPTLFFEQLLIASGRPTRAMWFVVSSQLLRLIALAFLVFISLEAAALALLVAFSVRVVLTAFMSRAYFGLRPAALLRAVLPALLTALLLGAAVYVSRMATATPGALVLPLLSAAAAAGVVWITLVFLMRHPVSLELTNLVSKLRARTG